MSSSHDAYAPTTTMVATPLSPLRRSDKASICAKKHGAGGATPTTTTTTTNGCGGCGGGWSSVHKYNQGCDEEGTVTTFPETPSLWSPESSFSSFAGNVGSYAANNSFCSPQNHRRWEGRRLALRDAFPVLDDLTIADDTEAYTMLGDDSYSLFDDDDEFSTSTSSSSDDDEEGEGEEEEGESDHLHHQQQEEDTEKRPVQIVLDAPFLMDQESERSDFTMAIPSRCRSVASSRSRKSTTRKRKKKAASAATAPASAVSELATKEGRPEAKTTSALEKVTKIKCDPNSSSSSSSNCDKGAPVTTPKKSSKKQQQRKVRWGFLPPIEEQQGAINDLRAGRREETAADAERAAATSGVSVKDRMKAFQQR